MGANPSRQLYGLKIEQQHAWPGIKASDLDGCPTLVEHNVVDSTLE